MIGRLLVLAAFATAPWGAVVAQFDHTHGAWTALLKNHVVVVDGGKASQARYAGFASDRAQLKGYLDRLSSVSEAEFKGWSMPEQMAFLINAYNAFAVEKILTRYPDIKSIWDFGKVFGNPFKDKFFVLLGRPASLDDVEHGTLRAKGVFAEPRVHYAVNCASIGCPMLREEAYVAGRLDAQLDEQARRFLADRSRNRFNAQKGSLEVSKIFDWFKEDWASGYRGFDGTTPAIESRERYFARHAKLLADAPGDRKVVEDGKAAIVFLEYDWTLNDAKQ